MNNNAGQNDLESDLPGLITVLQSVHANNAPIIASPVRTRSLGGPNTHPRFFIPDRLYTGIRTAVKGSSKCMVYSLIGCLILKNSFQNIVSSGVGGGLMFGLIGFMYSNSIQHVQLVRESEGLVYNMELLEQYNHNVGAASFIATGMSGLIGPMVLEYNKIQVFNNPLLTCLTTALGWLVFSSAQLLMTSLVIPWVSDMSNNFSALIRERAGYDEIPNNMQPF